MFVFACAWSGGYSIWSVAGKRVKISGWLLFVFVVCPSRCIFLPLPQWMISTSEIVTRIWRRWARTWWVFEWVFDVAQQVSVLTDAILGSGEPGKPKFWSGLYGSDRTRRLWRLYTRLQKWRNVSGRCQNTLSIFCACQGGCPPPQKEPDVVFLSTTTELLFFVNNLA